MEYVIETFGLTKIFRDWWGRAKVKAVNDIDLNVKSNEVFGLLGPNGSGKTTTIKLLLGLLNPTRGRASVLGGSATNLKISSRIGFMPEESYLYKYLTAREILRFYGKLFSLPSKVLNFRIDELIDMVGLAGAANRQVGTFSKGMARRIGLAQALINDPDLLILDEPTTGLDPIGTRQIKDLILMLAKRGKTVLMCSHLLADVEDICDRIAIMYGGKIQSQGHVNQLLKQTNKTEIITDNLSDEALEKIKKILQNENVDFNVHTPMDRLEHFFVKTIHQAQKDEISTSGAFSTTKISTFLSEQSTETNEDSKTILDELVKAGSAPTKGIQTDTETKPTQKSPQEINNDLLDKLTNNENAKKQGDANA